MNKAATTSVQPGHAAWLLPVLMALVLPVGCGAPVPDSFQISATPAWGATRGNANIGLKLASKYCVSCHLVAGQGKVLLGAPPFDETAGKVTTDAAFLRRWLQTPNTVKPGTLMPNLGLTDQEVEHLIAFLYSLREEGPAAGRVTMDEKND